MQWILVSVALKKWYVSFDAQCITHSCELDVRLFYESYSVKHRMIFHSVCHWRHSLVSDVSDHFFWSEYRVNRTRFHSLSSELESSEIYSSTNEISSLYRWSDFFFYREYEIKFVVIRLGVISRALSLNKTDDKLIGKRPQLYSLAAKAEKVA